MGHMSIATHHAISSGSRQLDFLPHPRSKKSNRRYLHQRVNWPFSPDLPAQLVPILPSDDPITALDIHDCLEVGYCHEGEGVFVVEGKTLPFSAGCVNVVNPREYHFAQSKPGTESRWSFLLIDPARMICDPLIDRSVLDIESLCGPEFPNILRPDKFDSCCRLVQLLVEEMASTQLHRADAVRALTSAMMVQLNRLPGRVPASELPASGERLSSMDKITPALSYIAHHFSDDTSIAVLADRCSMSEPSLRRNFQSALAQSPKEYVIRFRINKALTLLADPARSVLDVALSCGFQAISAFNAHFRACLGVSPREWRSSSKQQLGPQLESGKIIGDLRS